MANRSLKNPEGETNGCQDYSHISRKLWGVIAVAAGLGLLALVTVIPMAWYERLVLSAMLAHSLYLVFFFLVFLSILATHKWSIHVVSRLYQKALENRRLQPNEQDLLGNRGCGYCGFEHAPVVCRECNSIQWPGLRHDKTGIKNKSFWAAGAFVAHHRFQLLATVLTALFLGVLPLVVRVEQGRIAATQAQIQGLGDGLESIVRFRSTLLALESLCPISTGGPITKHDFCQKQYSELLASYLEFSWHGPQTVALASSRHCPTRLVSRFKEIKLVPKSDEEGFNQYARLKSCYLLREANIVDNVDARFAAYATLFANKATQCVERIAAARELFRAGKRAACLFIFAAAPTLDSAWKDSGHLPSHEGCAEEIEKIDRQAVIGNPKMWLEDSKASATATSSLDPWDALLKQCPRKVKQDSKPDSQS